ncbi:MAG: hypothetical protein ACD_80C00086G0003 [uncultured bacterium (gcode 4)]|uniref:Uncharacterized protein n=1 Tax=uncultured bacterium (gcode 4) TaxID=1234023 RepID=K1X561_9BACT|nr:MAG: hypothetical protein ACD_80C00086G0003 [uncultured bacterium (gcode 4)]
MYFFVSLCEGRNPEGRGIFLLSLNPPVLRTTPPLTKEDKIKNIKKNPHFFCGLYYLLFIFSLCWCFCGDSNRGRYPGILFHKNNRILKYFSLRIYVCWFFQLRFEGILSAFVKCSLPKSDQCPCSLSLISWLFFSWDYLIEM